MSHLSSTGTRVLQTKGDLKYIAFGIQESKGSKPLLQIKKKKKMESATLVLWVQRNQNKPTFCGVPEKSKPILKVWANDRRLTFGFWASDQNPM